MIECTCKIVGVMPDFASGVMTAEIEQCPRCAAVPRMVKLLLKEYLKGCNCKLCNCKLCSTLPSPLYDLLRELQVIE